MFPKKIVEASAPQILPCIAFLQIQHPWQIILCSMQAIDSFTFSYSIPEQQHSPSSF